MRSIAWGLFLTGILTLSVGAEAQKKPNPPQPEVYRWVDENGDVHFSESLPPDLREDQVEVQRKKGNVWQHDETLTPAPAPVKKKPPEVGELPRDSSGLKRPNPRYTPQQLKAQQDALLLLRYDSDQEIIDEMNVEIKQLDYDRRVLNTSRNSMLEAYRGNIREAAERQRAGVGVEDELIGAIRHLEQRLAANHASLSTLDGREEAIRKSFESELQRYRALVEAKKAADG